MKIKLEKVVASANSLAAISALKLPVAVAFRISKTLNEIQAVMDIFNERREELVKAFNEKREALGLADGEKLPQDLVEGFNVDMRVILSEEVELDVKLIKISDLEGQDIEASHLVQLTWLIDDSE